MDLVRITSAGGKRQYWKCPKCKATIGAHPNGKPVGFVADKETRCERRKAHADIDCYMLIVGITMDQMYARIAELMEMSSVDAHIGKFNLAQCRRLRELLIQDLLRVVAERSRQEAESAES